MPAPMVMLAMPTTPAATPSAHTLPPSPSSSFGGGGGGDDGIGTRRWVAVTLGVAVTLRFKKELVDDGVERAGARAFETEVAAAALSA